MKNNGISLISLIITILVIAILAAVMIPSGVDKINSAKLATFNDNILTLKQEAIGYLMLNDEYPAKTDASGNPIVYSITNNPSLLSEITKKNDQTDTFYIIDLDKLKIDNKDNGVGKTMDDYYIIAKDSGNIYYAKGIKIGNVVYHTKLNKGDGVVAVVPTSAPTPTSVPVANSPKLVAGMTPIKFIKLSESKQSIEDFEDTTYTYTITGSWTRTTTKAYAGSYSLMSNIINHNQSTSIVVNINATIPAGKYAVLKYWYLTDTEVGYDILSTIINGTMQPQHQKSGQGDWQYEELILLNGANTVEFKYSKDNSTSIGTDRVYIDDLGVCIKDGLDNYQVANSYNAGNEWYDYTRGINKWANVKLADGSMFVWIPRYTYKILSGEHSSTTGDIDIRFSNGTTDDTSGGYRVHPAFYWGGWDIPISAPMTKQLGGVELTGIWVGKFEPSNDSGKIKIVVGRDSWRRININDMHNQCRAMQTVNWSTYGISTDSSVIDTHLLKNSEWGAVAYLSKYALGPTEVATNLSSYYITANGDIVANKSQSTTGNEYGIYDMSGGAHEFLAAYLDNNHSNLNAYGASLVNAGTPRKYKDVFPKAVTDDKPNNYAAMSQAYGLAIYETSDSESGYNGWFEDYVRFPDNEQPFLTRGGNYGWGSASGLFHFQSDNGAPDYPYSFRVTCAVP